MSVYVLIFGASTVSGWFLSVFSGVRTVLTALPVFYLLQKLWIENSTQFLMQLLSGTVTCLLFLKFILNI